MRDRPDLVDAVRAAVQQHGPLTSAGLERVLGHRRVATGPKEWGWNWNVVKRAIEYLFWAGQVSSVGRTVQFERRYADPAAVLPAEIVAAPDPDRPDAIRGLVRIASAALGVATEPDLRDYFRLKPPDSRRAVAELVEAGELLAVAVDGWERPAYLAAGARFPRQITARALLSPFDSLIWSRPRADELFGFRYRLEIYTPAEKRVHGYYVLPFLLGESLVARVDLKAVRAGRRPAQAAGPAGGRGATADGGSAGVLLVRAAWLEPGQPAGMVAAELADELAELAAFLGLEDVLVEPMGDLAGPLAAAFGRLAGVVSRDRRG